MRRIVVEIQDVDDVTEQVTGRHVMALGLSEITDDQARAAVNRLFDGLAPDTAFTRDERTGRRMVPVHVTVPSERFARSVLVPADEAVHAVTHFGEHLDALEEG